MPSGWLPDTPSTEWGPDWRKGGGSSWDAPEPADPEVRVRTTTGGVTRRVRNGARASVKAKMERQARIESDPTRPAEVGPGAGVDPSSYWQAANPGVAGGQSLWQQAVGGVDMSKVVGTAAQMAARGAFTPVIGTGFFGAPDMAQDFSRQLPVQGPAYMAPSGTPQRVPMAANDDALVGYGNQAVSAAQQYGEIMSRHENDISQFITLRNEAMDAGEAEVAAEYDKAIAEAEGKLAEAKTGRDNAMAAYEHYSELTRESYKLSTEAAIAGETVRGDAFAGRADQAAQAVGETFDASAEDVAETAELIGTGNEALSGSLADQVNQFAGMYESAARGGIDDIDKISAAGAKFASAMATQVAAQDAYMTDLDRQELELKINSQLDSIKDSIEQLEEDKATAIANARNQIAGAYGSPDFFEDPMEAWDYTLDQFAALNDWDFEELGAVRDWFAQLKKADVTDLAGAESWIAEQVYNANFAGVTELFLSRLGRDLDPENPQDVSMANLLEQIATNPGDETAFRRLERLSGVGVADYGFGDDSEYDHLKDAFSLWQSHVAAWDKRGQATSHLTGVAIADGYGFQGGTATNPGKVYQGAELDRLLMDAAMYAFGDQKLAQQWVMSGGLQKIINSESSGHVGIINYDGWKEVGLSSKYDTAGYIDAAVKSTQGDWSGFRHHVDGDKWHSAVGLGQLNTVWYGKFVPELGGAKSIGNPFAEAVAMIRYAKATCGTPGSCWRKYQKSGY